MRITQWGTRWGWVCLLCLLAGCSTAGPPRPYVDEDAYARYYLTDTGRVLRVERDGTILDITCLPKQFTRDTSRDHLPHSLCESEDVKVLGKAKRVGDQWDLSGYHIEPETGTCRSLFPFKRKEWEEARRHSCWNRLWEVPAAVVFYPTVAVIAVGIITAPIWVPLVLFL